jgi:hypothetical protein
LVIALTDVARLIVGVQLSPNTTEKIQCRLSAFHVPP